jgi:hypothetical protein
LSPALKTGLTESTFTKGVIAQSVEELISGADLLLHWLRNNEIKTNTEIKQLLEMTKSKAMRLRFIL